MIICAANPAPLRKKLQKYLTSVYIVSKYYILYTVLYNKEYQCCKFKRSSFK